MRKKTLSTNHGDIPLPAFFPDGTYGAVRCVDAADLENCAVPGVVMNGYHLLQRPGPGVLRQFGGLHRFCGWDGPILTDSGGFQVFSLIHENPKYGEIRRNELIFRPDGGEKLTLTPEKSIQSQFAFGSDIMMCLDYCTHPAEPYETNRLSVEITVEWAARCKSEYERQLAARKIADAARPKLFAIIQGGGDRELRKHCAEALAAIGFDGYGFGGWPVSADGELMEDILAYTAELMPDDKIKYAMGLGKPDGILKCTAMGYDLFDCVIPTREARHNRLYVMEDEQNFAFGRHYILDERYIRDVRPVSELCSCPACARYSRAYLYHLFKTGDSLAYRLATMHNLRFYTRWMALIRERNGASRGVGADGRDA